MSLGRRLVHRLLVGTVPASSNQRADESMVLSILEVLEGQGSRKGDIFPTFCRNVLSGSKIC